MMTEIIEELIARAGNEMIEYPADMIPGCSIENCEPTFSSEEQEWRKPEGEPVKYLP